MVKVDLTMATSDEGKWVGDRHAQYREQMVSQLSRADQELDLLIGAAQRIVKRDGIAGITIREVLAEAQLATRAFYRHFSSRDELIAALFTQGAQREAERLLGRMKDAKGPLDGVIAWIDARLDHAFDRRVAASLRDLALEAQVRRSQMPAELESSLDLILVPLIEQLRLGSELGIFSGIDPKRDAYAIHDVTMAIIERKWSGFSLRRSETRQFVLRFCLRALGVPAS
jgi:AcrR family transcriptional regulator